MKWLGREILALAVVISATLHATSPGLSATADANSDWEPFRKHCRDLLSAHGSLKGPIPAATLKTVRDLLDGKAENTEATANTIEELLDPYCLLVVTINPESRVKAARGAAPARLHLHKEEIALIKVINEAGVTHALQITGPELLPKDGRADERRWLTLVAHGEAPLRRALNGHRVEYRLVGLTPHQSGKREAILKFDVGQGTQDLGFRGEVPILFVVASGSQ
jgi:hypothetical protein